MKIKKNMTDSDWVKLLKEKTKEELNKHKKDENYSETEESNIEQNSIFLHLQEVFGYDWEADNDAFNYFLKATQEEILQYVLDDIIPGIEKANNVKEVKRIIEKSKEEILKDIKKGTIPKTVESFSELHDYVDANCYAGTCDDKKFRLSIDNLNKVQNALDKWIKSDEFQKEIKSNKKEIKKESQKENKEEKIFKDPYLFLEKYKNKLEHKNVIINGKQYKINHIIAYKEDGKLNVGLYLNSPWINNTHGIYINKHFDSFLNGDEIKDMFGEEKIKLIIKK